MGTPVLTVPASPPPPTTPANHVCHRLCCQVHRSRRCHRRSRRVRSWNWLRVRLPDHRLPRNPSLKQQLFSYAILGFALSEAMGLFCLMMAFLLLFALEEGRGSEKGTRLVTTPRRRH